MPSRVARRVLVICVLQLLAGCASLGPDDPAGGEGLAPRPVVVALLDSGIFAGHEAFVERGQASAARLAPRVGAEVVTPGNRSAPLEREALYALAGTRLLGISFAFDETPVLEDVRRHGTGTASLVARDAPDAVLVMVQVEGKGCAFDADTSCFIDDSVARGMEWAAAQPWIDIISVSIGIPGNKPPVASNEPESERYLAATRAAAASGKLIVNSAGNEPTPSQGDYFNGPPWIIAVGGGNFTQRGSTTQGSVAVDVLANFSEWVATASGPSRYGFASGTSVSAPVVAATLARALTKANDEGWGPASEVLEEPRLTPARAGALRDALNVSALAWGPADFDATGLSPTDPLATLQSASVPVAAPGVQDGWGFVHAGLADDIAEAMRDSTAPTDAARTQVMAQYQASREALWG